ncbi:FAD-dependent oxidoreductase [Caballeronia sp. 15715]|uniref:FAD-dependent oxidoreductase n=1 Tax=Caballeronia sp. 15715 TaxID=3391030 RepID=UPI0039E3A028
MELLYDKLIVATGSKVRNGEVIQAPVHYLRTLQDSLSLRPLLREGAGVAIVGGSFIGLEIAAVARSPNRNVTVREAQANLLAQSSSRALSDWMCRLHVAQNVKVPSNTKANRITRASSGRPTSDTSAGTVIADVVVVGIGVMPNDELA